ncbi:hypothetical protein ACF07T_27015 [Streptomyces sp. NPDC015184]|uniref:hypothetical protein n=1 Tax=Streptomyces sp. NPDC015184 TaxID=3364946 RepID=UPI0036FE4D2E
MLLRTARSAVPAEHGLPFSTWSPAEPADFLAVEGVVDGISHEGLRIMLRELPPLIERWRTGFTEKHADQGGHSRPVERPERPERPTDRAGQRRRPPLLRHVVGLIPSASGTAHRRNRSRPLGYDALDRTMSTSRPAETPRLPLPTASRHTTAPREAGPVTSRRHGRSVLHTRTAPGTALLEGVPPEGGAL